MYKITKDGGYINPYEMHLGKLPDEVELVQDDNEAFDTILIYVCDNGELPEVVTTEDDLDDSVIELKVSDYLVDEEIDALNEVVQYDCVTWELQHLQILLEVATKHVRT